MNVKVEDVMVKQVVTIEGGATVKEDVEIMDKFEIGCLIVVRLKKALGTLTERDFLKRVVAVSKDAAKSKVKDVMTSPQVVAQPNVDLKEDGRLMFQMKIKLPVVDDKRLVGLVSLTDIARFQPEMITILKNISSDRLFFGVCRKC